MTTTATSTRDLAKMKARIAQLLAQAENTPYPAEAETFSAAAEKLMLRLGIARAELESIGTTKPEPVVEVRREYRGIFAVSFIPYVSAIARGFGHVTTLQSSANRGRLRTSYLIGTESDIAELTALLNSLDVQVLAALHAWRKEPEQARVRAYSSAMDKELLDRSFIEGFGSRVGARLREARTVQEKEVKGTGTELVLVGKDERVKEWVAGTYGGNLRRVTSRRGYASQGAAAGRAAANNANLGQKGLGSRKQLGS